MKIITAYQTLFTSVYFDCVSQSDTVNHCWNRIWTCVYKRNQVLVL